MIRRSDRDARLAITSAIGKWKTRFPQADAELTELQRLSPSPQVGAWREQPETRDRGRTAGG